MYVSQTGSIRTLHIEVVDRQSCFFAPPAERPTQSPCASQSSQPVQASPSIPPVPGVRKSLQAGEWQEGGRPGRADKPCINRHAALERLTAKAPQKSSPSFVKVVFTDLCTDRMYICRLLLYLECRAIRTPCQPWSQWGLLYGVEGHQVGPTVPYLIALITWELGESYTV